MKRTDKAPRWQVVTATLLTAGFLAAPLTGWTAEGKVKPAAKPYPLKVCLVSDEAFGGDMGDPYVFVHEGREIKLCCKACLKDFKKDIPKYLKKLDEAEKKPQK